MTILALSCGAPKNKNSRGDKGDGQRRQRDNQAANPADAIDYPNYLKSQIFRTRGSKQLTYKSGAALVAANAVPAWIHNIPDPNLDNDRTVTKAIAPEANCGTGTFANINARIEDCKKLNAATSVWSGFNNGIAGEGNWYLVAKNGGNILWMDATTALIWSSSIGSLEWARASGARGFAKEMPCIANKDNAGLGNIPEEQIAWRLPTRAEFLQADINGARYVLPNLDSQYWTASFDDGGRAWSITQESGILESIDENSTLSVRCVGVIKK